MHYGANKTNGRRGKQRMRRDEELVCGDSRGEEGVSDDDGGRGKRRISDGEACGTVCLPRLFSRRPWTGVVGGFERSPRFLS